MRNFIIRTITGLLFAATLIASIVYSPFTLIALFSVIAGLTIWEFSSIVNKHANASVNTLINSVAGFYLVCAVGGFSFGYTGAKEFIPYLITLIYLLISELYRRAEYPLKNWAYAFASQVYIALPFSLLAFLGSWYDPFTNKISYEFIMPLSVFIFLWMSDSGAYLCGSLLSRYIPAKLFPRISPSKSWIGSVGGGLLCVAVALVIHNFFPSFRDMTALQWVGLALTVCISGTYGDLIESMLKRQLGIKDSGNILPGHGGFLDRFDSSLLAIPATIIYLYCVGVC